MVAVCLPIARFLNLNHKFAKLKLQLSINTAVTHMAIPESFDAKIRRLINDSNYDKKDRALKLLNGYRSDVRSKKKIVSPITISQMLDVAGIDDSDFDKWDCAELVREWQIGQVCETTFCLFVKTFLVHIVFFMLYFVILCGIGA